MAGFATPEAYALEKEAVDKRGDFFEKMGFDARGWLIEDATRLPTLVGMGGVYALSFAGGTAAVGRVALGNSRFAVPAAKVLGGLQNSKVMLGVGGLFYGKGVFDQTLAVGKTRPVDFASAGMLTGMDFAAMGIPSIGAKIPEWRVKSMERKYFEQAVQNTPGARERVSVTREATDIFRQLSAGPETKIDLPSVKSLIKNPAELAYLEKTLPSSSTFMSGSSSSVPQVSKVKWMEKGSMKTPSDPDIMAWSKDRITAGIEKNIKGKTSADIHDVFQKEDWGHYEPVGPAQFKLKDIVRPKDSIKHTELAKEAIAGAERVMGAYNPTLKKWEFDPTTGTTKQAGSGNKAVGHQYWQTKNMIEQLRTGERVSLNKKLTKEQAISGLEKYIKMLETNPTTKQSLTDYNAPSVQKQKLTNPGLAKSGLSSPISMSGILKSMSSPGSKSSPSGKSGSSPFKAKSPFSGGSYPSSPSSPSPSSPSSPSSSSTSSRSSSVWSSPSSPSSKSPISAIPSFPVFGGGLGGGGGLGKALRLNKWTKKNKTAAELFGGLTKRKRRN
jgi:hypothetical protein